MTSRRTWRWRAVLLGYFPGMVRGKFEQEIRHHRLAREIICTRLANDLIDRVGPGFLYGIEHRAGATTPETVSGVPGGA